MEHLKVRSLAVREFLAELLGTFVLTCIGCCVNAFITVNREGPYGHMIAPWGWGMALTAAIYVCGGVSGGHVNPAVTLGMASVGKLPWRKVPHYFVGQYLGAFMGAVVTFVVYQEALTNRIGKEFLTAGPNGTAGIFGTLPTSGNTTCFVDQVVAVAFFLLLICAITDKKNMATPKGLIPFMIGVTDLGLVIFAFGYNCGAPINPARDFAPRLFTAMAGWGSSVFSYQSHYFWIPIFACHIGGVLGCWIYKLFIELHWPEEEEKRVESKKKKLPPTVFPHPVHPRNNIHSPVDGLAFRKLTVEGTSIPHSPSYPSMFAREG